VASWIVQVLTLAGVALGALGSFASTRLIENVKWKREQAVWWNSRRLECYTEFATAIKRHITISQRIVVTLGLPSTGQALDPEVGLPMLAEAEQDLSIKWEQVLMIGSPKTITAAAEWRHVAWHTEWFARGLRADPVEYEQAAKDGGRARRRFYNAIRVELGITSGEIPKLEWPPRWREPITKPDS
jgi:hypothetical protein